MELQLINKNFEKILIVVFYGQNRLDEITEYHKKVCNKLKIPVNYVEFPFEKGYNHAFAIDWFIQQTHQLTDYWIFLDNDSIPLREDFIDIYYGKMMDKETLVGTFGQSNHLIKRNGEYSHPYIYTAGMGLSKQLYIKLGCPSFQPNKESDTGESLTWACEDKGFNICGFWPKSTGELTLEECQKHNIDYKHRKSAVGQHWFGFSTTYGQNILYHQFCAPIERSKIEFINKCKQILGENEGSYLEGVITCVDYGDILELTLSKNKKHFDNLIVITDLEDKKTKEVCDRNNVQCIQTDDFYNKGTIFNKGAAINLGYKNLKHYDWCINLDADIILPDNFRHSFFAHKLDKNELYGCARKFIWNYEQYEGYFKNNLNEELLTLDGIGVGYFQAFNFNSNKIKNVPKDQLYFDSNTAEQVDINFLYRFYPPPHPQVPKLFFEVIHLGPPGLFNKRKINSSLAKLDFKNFPNISDNEIFKDYPDIYEHKSKPEQKYNQYYKLFKNTINHRDFVFRMCLEEFEKQKKPLNILEIGTSRGLNGKEGDGWSTFFWCEYIKKFGGSLTVCDVDKNAIETCKLLVTDYLDKIDIKFIIDDGAKYINDSFDIIFLDGSDDPNQMMEQFEKINRVKTKILCDDFHVKGKTVREKYKDFQLIKVNEVHEMAIYEKNN